MSAVEMADLKAILETAPESIRREAAKAAAGGAERRAHPRLSDEQLRWLRRSRLKNGPEVSVVDISTGGALIEGRIQLNPGAVVTLELTCGGNVIDVPSEVLRCGIASLHGTAVIYRGAFSFSNPLAIDRMQPPGPAGAAIDAPSAAAGAWQKIVVRYREGGMLKGFTMDFHPSRGHLSLWPSVNAPARERAIVPLTRLKALFFVKDFAGNAAHVGSNGPDKSRAGRQIEVTFFDREVVRGTTLNYRPDGVGFFITPADSEGNNQRVFVINAAVRQVRFP